MPKVRVPQQDGTISISVAGDEPTTWPVTDGETSVANDKLDLFLGKIEGSSLVERARSSSSAKKES